jgi:hypothetical protein
MHCHVTGSHGSGVPSRITADVPFRAEPRLHRNFFFDNQTIGAVFTGQRAAGLPVAGLAADDRRNAPSTIGNSY